MTFNPTDEDMQSIKKALQQIPRWGGMEWPWSEEDQRHLTLFIGLTPAVIQWVMSDD